MTEPTTQPDRQAMTPAGAGVTSHQCLTRRGSPCRRVRPHRAGSMEGHQEYRLTVC